jgi:hypothetical protein
VSDTFADPSAQLDDLIRGRSSEGASGLRLSKRVTHLRGPPVFSGCSGGGEDPAGKQNETLTATPSVPGPLRMALGVIVMVNV